MTKQELAQKIKTKYPQYQNIEDNELADKIIAKYPVYKSQITESGQSFSGLKASLGERGEQFKDIAEKTETGEINPLQSAVRTIGTTIGGAGDILFQVIKEGVKAVSPKTVEAIKGGVAKIGENKLVQDVASKYSNWATRNPEQAKDLEATLNIASILPVGKVAQVGTKAVGQAAKTTGRALQSGVAKIKPAIGKTLTTTGAIGEKAGKTLVSATYPPTPSQAKSIISYKAKTPLKQRVELAAQGIEKAPITPAEVAIKYDLTGISRAEIASKAKRTANELFENQVKPVVEGIKKKVKTSDLFEGVKKEIAKISDTSRKKSLLNALNALKDDYKSVSNLSYQRLDKIKSEMAKKLPSKVWKGEDIAGDINNVRKMFSDKARQVIRKELPDNVKRIYDEYGSLLTIIEKGEKSLQRSLDVGVLGLTSEAIRKAGTPLTTLGGRAISQIGTATKKLGNRLLKSKPLPKAKGEILKSTQKLDSLNPTGGVFAKYTPKQRATAELADNITTLDKTMGKSADEMITVYRGSSNGGEIVPGDFITTNKQLAKDYAGTGKVLEKKVKLSDILDDTTEPLGEEYIYRPNKSQPLKSIPLKTGDYLYHGTNEDVLDNIIKEGLKPGMRGQLSLSKTEDYAKSFARDGITPKGKTSGIMLRIKTDALNGKTTLKRADGKTRPMSDQLNEILTKETVSPESLEILKNGKWIPLSEYKKTRLK